MERHRELMTTAIERDGEAQRALLAGDPRAAAAAFAEASACYRRSWETAPPGSFGRLVGMLKSAVLAGEGHDQAAYVRAATDSEDAQSPTAAYALAIAALIFGDDEAALEASEVMRRGSDAFGRTADAVAALARGDGSSYSAAIAAIVADFEQRSEHLTGVPIADTALMLERIAAGRGITAGVQSALLPAVPSSRGRGS